MREKQRQRAAKALANEQQSLRASAMVMRRTHLRKPVPREVLASAVSAGRITEAERAFIEMGGMLNRDRNAGSVGVDDRLGGGDA